MRKLSNHLLYEAQTFAKENIRMLQEMTYVGNLSALKNDSGMPVLSGACLLHSSSRACSMFADAYYHLTSTQTDVPSSAAHSYAATILFCDA